MIADLLARLRDLDVRLSVRGDKLHVSAPKEVLTQALLDELRPHKAALLRLLSRRPTCSGCANLRMAEVPWDRPPYHRFVWGCARGHLEHGHTLPDLHYLEAPDSCLIAGDHKPAFNDKRTETNS